MRERQSHAKQGRSSGLFRLKIGAGGILLCLGLAAFWRHWSHVTGDFTPPTPTLPVPNAHDTYVAAGKILRDERKIGYAAALDHAGKDKDDHPYTLAQKRKLVEQNRAALAQLRLGLTQVYYLPPIRSLEATMPYYVQFRQLGRLLRVEQELRWKRSDAEGAVNSGLDALQMGVQISRGATYIGDRLSIAIEAIGRRELWQEIPALNAAQTRRAIGRVQTIRGLRTPFADVVQQEKWWLQAGLQEILRQSDWQNNLLAGSSSSLQQRFERLRLTVYGTRGVLRNYTRYMEEMQAVVALPYYQHAKFPKLPTDPVNQLLATDADKFRLYHADAQTQDDMLLLALCLHAYHLEHRKYPQSLAELVPEYLLQLPIDQFAANGAYGYKTTPQGYVLYSVGPDGRDDGGAAIDDKTKISAQAPHSNNRYATQLQSKGDIVAGINP